MVPLISITAQKVAESKEYHHVRDRPVQPEQVSECAANVYRALGDFAVTIEVVAGNVTYTGTGSAVVDRVEVEASATIGGNAYTVDGDSVLTGVETAFFTGDVTVSNTDAGITNAAVFVDADGEGNFVEYNTAADGSGDAVFVEAGTTNLTTEEFGLDDDAVTPNPLAALDTALNQVDSLRSELGAVQNRFEDAINNLSTNETNLAAARSRILQNVLSLLG